MKKLYAAILLVFFLAASAWAEVNINTASKEELNGLPGIGPVKAEAIIQYRKEKGPFKSLDELKNVYGIGDKIFARIKNEISLGSPETAAEADKAAVATKSVPAAATQTQVKTTTAQSAAPAEKKEAAAPQGNKPKP